MLTTDAITVGRGTIQSSCVALSGGADVVAGTGSAFGLDYIPTPSPGGPPTAGDTFTVSFVNIPSGSVIQVGYGQATGIPATFCFTYADKEYVLAGSSVYFSKVDDPTSWNEPFQTPSLGNGFVDLTKWLSNPEDIIAIAPYQGKLAFLSRHTCQIWSVSADPLQWSIFQTPSNIGTMAPGSVQPLGELDVLFLSDTGIRSLKARDSSGYAYIDDAGSAVDGLIQLYLKAHAVAAAKAVSVVNPEDERYWLYLPGSSILYVRSAFLSSQINAWTQYSTTYDNLTAPPGNMISFDPQKFVVFNGQVFCRDGTKLFQYGGSNGSTYDRVQAVAELPFLGLGTPGTRKQWKGIGLALTDTWHVLTSSDPVSGSIIQKMIVTDSTFDKGKYPLNESGTHLKTKLFTDAASSNPAVLSAIMLHYEEGDEQ